MNTKKVLKDSKIAMTVQQLAADLTASTCIGNVSGNDEAKKFLAALVITAF